MVQQFIKKDGSKIAYHKISSPGSRSSQSIGVIFLGGFRSDMTGSKAVYLETLCQQSGRSYVRFDYFAHGASSGNFKEATLGRWLDDTLVVLDELTQGPQILVGSSMGGWLMLLATLKRPERIKALVGIAAAPDFLDDFERLTPEQQNDLATKGVCYIPSDTGSYPLTKQLVEEGRQHRVLQDAIPIQCPVRLLHGLADSDVPWQKSIVLSEQLLSKDVVVTLIKGGDPRLSSAPQLKLLGETVLELLDSKRIE